jgi:hypothetical protein
MASVEVLELVDDTRLDWRGGGGRPVRTHLWRPRPPRTPAQAVVVPNENAERYTERIPGADGRSVGADVGHYVFLADNPEGAEIRRRVAADAVAFCRTSLG